MLSEPYAAALAQLAVAQTLTTEQLFEVRSLLVVLMHCTSAAFQFNFLMRQPLLLSLACLLAALCSVMLHWRLLCLL
jgi:hypothetical protein